MRLFPQILLLIFLACSSVFLRAETPGVVVSGNARFTVITPNLIRMEYAPDGKFVDLPSWFAVERATRDTDAQITAQNGKVEIDTGAIHLTYQGDGKPFSADNLQAEIKKGDDKVPWKPGLPSTQNLGGTIRTVDGLFGPVSLGEGVLSRDGWYLLDDSKSALFTNDWIQPRPKNGGFDWYLFGYGLDYRAALHSLTAVGGAVPLPRKYTMGTWYSRYWPYTADQFKQIVQEYEDHGFPLDNIVMDMDWHLNRSPFPHSNTWTGYTFDRALIPDPAALLKWFHDQGLHITLNDHPAGGIQPHEEMYADFMRAMGQDPASGKTIPFDAGDKHYLDTSYQYSHLPREKDGVDFWWLDWQQYPNTISLPDLTNLQVLNFYNFTRSEADGLRGQSFSRWAGWGDHRYPIEFSGDAFINWPMLSFEVPFTSTAGNVGAFFWTHDIGGHWGPRDAELYARWVQFGALSAALRSHSTRDPNLDRRPWAEWGDLAEASMRRSFRLRSEMMPYLYTSAWQATKDSVPFIRPLYLDFPDVEQAYHNGQEYLFGDNLLVAPITQPGAGPNKVASQAVWFPKGDWFDFFTGESFTGPTEGIAADPLDSFPLYVQGGVPLPMQAYTHRPGSAPLTNLVLRCYPGLDGQSGSSRVYEDDGVTRGYEHGEFATTKLTYVRHGDEITLSVAPTQGTFKGQPSSRRCVVELPDTAKLTSCSQAGAQMSYDDKLMMNRIELPESSIQTGWTLVVHTTVIDPATVAQRAVAQHLQDLLGEPYEAWRAKNVPLAPGMEAAFAAAKGVSLVEQRLHPYFLDSSAVLLYCHNHQTAPDSVTVTVGRAAPTQVSLRSGDPVPGAPAPTVPTGVEAPLPTPVTVTLTDPSFDGLVLREAALHVKPPRPDWLDPANDLALKAQAQASSGNAAAAIDDVVGGYGFHGDRSASPSTEWVTSGEKVGAWIKLTWPQPIQANAVYIYDRPNLDDQVVWGTFEFDDGTTIHTNILPNDGTTPLRTALPLKTIHWLKFTVTKTSPKTLNVGLSEIAVTREK
jgi:alpha-glucosidase (family GH31 glycosyl hydrolase)